MLLPEIVLFQPDIPQNAGAILRLCACMDVTPHVIAPCGFPWDERRMRRAGMDYLDRLTIRHHASWQAFDLWRQDTGRRLVLMTTKGVQPLQDTRFAPDDLIVFGRESAGVPPDVEVAADARVMIPMRPGERSLNVAQSAAIVVWEAVRQGMEQGPGAS